MGSDARTHTAPAAREAALALVASPYPPLTTAACDWSDEGAGGCGSAEEAYHRTGRGGWSFEELVLRLVEAEGLVDDVRLRPHAQLQRAHRLRLDVEHSDGQRATAEGIAAVIAAVADPEPYVGAE